MACGDIIHNIGQDEANFEINLKVYPANVILKAGYIFVDKCFIYVDQKEKDRFIVHLKTKNPNYKINKIVGEFLNELLNQRLQDEVNKETGRIRELLTAQAFSEVKILNDESSKVLSYKNDPLNISELKGVGKDVLSGSE